jgi:SPX domain protein involved in polyphosphate accumulation
MSRQYIVRHLPFLVFNEAQELFDRTSQTLGTPGSVGTKM